MYCFKPSKKESEEVIQKMAPANDDLETYKTYGKHVFTGKVADTYMKKQGSSGSILKDPNWTKNNADVVAAAVLDW